MTRPVESSDHQDLQRRQAEVWAGAAEWMLDRIGVAQGWICADLGCGALGILPELSRRAGSSGRVIGLERDPAVAEAAREMAALEGLGNVQVVTADLAEHPLPRASFDLVHLRFALHLLAPRQALAEMVALVRPGGWIAVEEPDLSTWRYFPECPRWRRLIEIVSAAIGRRCDPSIGSQVPAMMEDAGVCDVRTRAVVLVLRERNPYMRLPLCWAATQREEILARELASSDELDGLTAELEGHLLEPEVMMLTFTTIQAWGRKAG